MERKPKKGLGDVEVASPTPIKPLWIKRTPGTIIIRQPVFLRIKHNQKFRATPEELGSTISKFELLEGEIDVRKFPELPDEEIVQSEKYDAVHTGGGLYDVVSPSGKIMKKGLKSDDAAALLIQLEEEQNNAGL